jgi:hypothetical protein
MDFDHIVKQLQHDIKVLEQRLFEKGRELEKWAKAKVLHETPAPSQPPPPEPPPKK